MEAVIAVVIGVLVTASVYLMLSRNLIKFILGLTLIGNAANLLIFACGGMTRNRPPLVPEGLEAPVGVVANPLPQALVLTAIVISFGVLSFALVLAYRAHEELGTVDTDAMRVAEPDESKRDDSNNLSPTSGRTAERPVSDADPDVTIEEGVVPA